MNQRYQRFEKRRNKSLFNAVAITLLSLITILLSSPSVSAQKPLDLAYEAATPALRVNYCSGRPGDARSYCWRNCTSYAAYKLEAAGVATSGYEFLGHARDWAENAQRKAITISTEPKVGAVAYWTTGGRGYGHVAWVEKVNDNGTVSTSNYDGFSESFYVVESAQPTGYIYFSNVVIDPPKPPPNTILESIISAPLKAKETSYNKILSLSKS